MMGLSKLLARAAPLAERLAALIEALDVQSLRLEKLSEGARRLQQESRARRERREAVCECTSLVNGAPRADEHERDVAENAG